MYGFLSKQQKRFKLLEPAHIQEKLPWEGQRHHIMQIMDWFGDGMDIDAKVFKSDLKSLNMAVKMYGSPAPTPNMAGAYASTQASGYSQQQRDANKTCFLCGVKGHVKANCKKAQGGAGKPGPGAGPPRGGPKKCFKCGQVGHIQAACPN